MLYSLEYHVAYAITAPSVLASRATGRPRLLSRSSVVWRFFRGRSGSRWIYKEPINYLFSCIMPLSGLIYFIILPSSLIDAFANIAFHVKVLKYSAVVPCWTPTCSELPMVSRGCHQCHSQLKSPWLLQCSVIVPHCLNHYHLGLKSLTSMIPDDLPH